MTQTTTPRAVYQACDPAMDGTYLTDGRGDLLYPVVLWVKCSPGHAQSWQRMSPVVELKLARRWQKTWSADGRTVAITAAHRLTKTVHLPVCR